MLILTIQPWMGVDFMAGIGQGLDGVDLMTGGGWFPIKMGVESRRFQWRLDLLSAWGVGSTGSGFASRMAVGELATHKYDSRYSINIRKQE